MDPEICASIRPDPIIEAPTDLVARITHAGICGSDLWSYRGIDHREPGDRMGHEWMRFVEEVGAEVRTNLRSKQEL